MTTRQYEPRRGWAARVARRTFRWRFRLLHARRYARVDCARVRGLTLTVLPGVFHPEFFFATAFFLRFLDTLPIGPGTRALDVGTGSGALAVSLARRGATVTATDINPRAVHCARANALHHDLAHLLEVREGDLFAPVADERFDLIVFNPPFYPRPARDMADRAWAAGPDSETVRRFLRVSPRHLRPGGRVLIMGSTEAPYTRLLHQVPDLHARCVAARELVSERLFLFMLQPDESRVASCACW
jgi:HemK-related putative methylase